jgi:predicted Zn-dependent protease
MVKYHRTSVLVSLGRCEEALVELDILKKLAPREPSVYFLLADVYSKVATCFASVLTSLS